MPLDFVVIYRDGDFDFWTYSSVFDAEPARYSGLRKITEETALVHQKRFEVFREMYRARDFRLILCADVFDSVVEHATKTLERFVTAEEAKGGLGHHHKPLIISERRIIRTRPIDFYMGCPVRGWSFPASAL